MFIVLVQRRGAEDDDGCLSPLITISIASSIDAFYCAAAVQRGGLGDVLRPKRRGGGSKVLAIYRCSCETSTGMREILISIVYDGLYCSARHNCCRTKHSAGNR